MSNPRARQALVAAGLGALLSAHIFILMPITVYVGNFEEFSVSLTEMLVLFARPALALVALIVLVGMLLPPAGSRRYSVILAGLTLLLWLQGNVFVWDYGLLDGRRIEWNAESWRGWIDGAAWVIIFGCAMLARRGAGKAVVVAASVVTVMLAVSSVVSIATHSADMGGKKSRGGENALQQFYRFSTTKNILHIVADGVQADIFANILSDGAIGGKIAQSLNGFVVFPNNLGAFPYTHMSVPAILSGKLYRNEMPIDSFLDSAVGKGSPTILNAAAAAGYEIDAAVTPGLEHLYALGAATNTYSLKPDLHVSASDATLLEAATLFDLAAFRLTPHLLKRHVYNDQLWFTQQLLTTTKFMGLRSFAHQAFLREMADKITVDRAAPVYKIMHVMTSHNPMATTADCQYAGEILPTIRETVTNQTRCGLLDIVAVLDRMKALGIYDSTTIVLMADHGTWIPPEGMKPKVLADGTRWGISPTTMAQAIPMFAVKPPNSLGPMQTSMAPSWIIDAAPTIAAMAGLSGQFEGRNALDLLPEEQRVRRFFYYKYQRTEWHSEYLEPIQEFLVDGPIVDNASWQVGTNHIGGTKAQADQ